MKSRELRAIVFLAYKDISRDKKIIFLVISLIAFSYINLTFFPAFINGLSNTFIDEIVDTSISHILIQPSPESGKQYLDFESSSSKKIELIPNVVGTSSRIYLTARIKFNGKEMTAQTVALLPSRERVVSTLHEKIIKGDFLGDGDKNQIVLGENIAGEKIEDRIGNRGFGVAVEGLGVDVGEKVTVVFPNGVEKEYRVKGVVGTEGFNVISSNVFITTKEAENVLGIHDKASNILVRLSNREMAEEVKNIIEGLGLKGAKIQTWKEASRFAEGINQTFFVVNIVTTFIGIIIVVSTVSIVIFINTSRKRRIIGVLKAIGMRSNLIFYVFLIESLLFGLMGSVIGFGALNVFLFYFSVRPINLPIGVLTPVLSFNDMISAFLLILAVSIIGGYLPAKASSKEEIVEALKVIE